MKQWKRLCAALLSGLLLTGSALAAGETVQVLQNVRFEASTATENQGKYTVTVTNDAIQNGKDYALLIAKGTIPANAEVGGTMAMPTIDSTTLTYIDQTTATLVDSKPTVTFENFIPKSVPNSVVLLGGSFNGYESPVVIGFINAQGVLVTGTIKFQSSSVGAIVKIYDTSNTLIDEVQTGSDGSYSIGNIVAGTKYNVVVTRPGYCSYTLKNFVFDDEPVLPEIQISYLAGDINSDGAINGYDLGKLLSDFNYIGDDILQGVADLNQDGAVNGYDLGFLLSSFNRGNVVVEYGN